LASVKHEGIIQGLSANVVEDAKSSVEKSDLGIGFDKRFKNCGHKAYV
jgi:hypothetical protein